MKISIFQWKFQQIIQWKIESIQYSCATSELNQIRNFFQFTSSYWTGCSSWCQQGCWRRARQLLVQARKRGSIFLPVPAWPRGQFSSHRGPSSSSRSWWCWWWGGSFCCPSLASWWSREEHGSIELGPRSEHEEMSKIDLLINQHEKEKTKAQKRIWFHPAIYACLFFSDENLIF